jgi:hypothetical protein
VNFAPRGKFLPLWGTFTLLFTSRDEYIQLFRRMEGRGDSLRGQLHPGSQLHP